MRPLSDRVLLDRLGVELPVVQAGMGGGLAGPELAGAVSDSGGLGTIGFTNPEELERALRSGRERSAKPLAVNLLLPFARRRHFEAAMQADLLVTFWGRPRRRGDGLWAHQCGSVEEALAAHRAGADAVIAQGVEAGGHVRGQKAALALLERVRAALPEGYPVLLAGGVAERADVSRALEAGAEAAVLGTRFLMTEESRAHPAYKRRLVDGEKTLLTELFSMAWPARHRVLPNAATERWLRDGRRTPGWIRAVNRVTAPAAARMRADPRRPPTSWQRPGLPFLSPLAPTAGAPDRLLEAAPLYAGETVARIDDIRGAGDLTRELAG